jgi:hypothetical protein
VNILPHGPAWDVDFQAEQPVLGDGCPFREQRLHIRPANGWECSDYNISRYGDLCLTFRHSDSNHSAELNIRPGDAAPHQLAAGLVWLIARLGDRHYGTPDERRLQMGRALVLLDRIEGAVAGARAELDRVEQEVQA